MSTPLHTVHVRVNDAATGQPTPCRIRFADASGTYHAPFGRQAEFARGWNEDVGGNVWVHRWLDPEERQYVEERQFTYIDGTCEIRLPVGPVHVEVHKGPEYKPLQQEINLPAGKLALRLSLERSLNLRAEGWYSGDTHCLFLTPHAALLEGAAEDLAVVNLLAREVFQLGSSDGEMYSEARKSYPIVPNLLAFSGQRPVLEMPGHLVVVNTYNYHGLSGELEDDDVAIGEGLALLNCHRIVYPLRIGGPNGEVIDWTMADWCDQCHRKGGLVLWRPFFLKWDEEACDHGEPLADLILGKIDALEIDTLTDRDVMESWYKLLDCGFQIPLAGGSGKTSNYDLLGFPRTYVRLREGEPFTYGNWIEALRAGRTFVTAGPLLTFTVNRRDPGSVLQLPEPGIIHVHVRAHNWEPFNRLQLIVNGEVTHEIAPSGWPQTADLEVDLPVQGNCWLVARCTYGGSRLRETWRDPPYAAHTSPVYVRFIGQPVRADPAIVARLLHQLDLMDEWLRTKARCASDRVRDDLAAIYERARQVLLRRQGA